MAQGVVNEHGWVILFFADSFMFFPTVEKMMAIHSHDGRTRFHWQDWPVPPKETGKRVWEIGEPPTVERGGALFLVRESPVHVPRVIQWFGYDDVDDPQPDEVWPAPGEEWSHLQN